MDSSWSLSFSAAGAPSCFAMSEDIFLNFFKSFFLFSMFYIAGFLYSLGFTSYTDDLEG